MTQSQRFAGQTVLVTGGSGGIGSEICRRFAAEGATVWVHFGGRGDAAEDTRASLEGSGHRVVGADLRDPSAISDMVERVVSKSGRLDVLVNNAGIFEKHSPTVVDYQGWQDAWSKILGINLVGAANACYCAAAHMRRLGGGKIVNISSRGAFRGEPECPAYGASKAGINALSQSLALALGGDGIHVYAVAPGFVETAMARPYLTSEMADGIRQQSPLGRVATVGDVAYWVLAMSDPQAAFATGGIIDVNGASYLRS